MSRRRDKVPKRQSAEEIKHSVSPSLRHSVSFRSVTRRAFNLVEVLVTVVIIVVLISIGLTVGKSVVGSGMKARTNEIIKNAELIATEYWALTGQNVNHLAVDDWNAMTNTGIIAAPINWTTPKPFNTAVKQGSAANNMGLTGSSPPNYGYADCPLGHRDHPTGDLITKSIDRFVWATQSISSLKSLYATFPDDVLTDRDTATAAGQQGTYGNEQPEGYLELRDAWGNKLVYAAYVRHGRHYGTDFNNEANSGNGEFLGPGADDFLPARSSPFFVSAGPDGQFGHMKYYNQKMSTGTVSGGKDWQALHSRAEMADQVMDNIYSFGVLGDQ